MDKVNLKCLMIMASELHYYSIHSDKLYNYLGLYSKKDYNYADCCVS